MKYNWQQKDWRQFSFDKDIIEEQLFLLAEKIGTLKGSSTALSEKTKNEILIDTLVSEAIKTSEIEGEFLNRIDVMSSIKNNLGLQPKIDNIRDAHAKGMAKLVTEIHQNYEKLLTTQDLFDWHTLVIPPKSRIHTGVWRTHEDPMQVVSGSLGKTIVHFEAPPSAIVAAEMEQFIQWVHDTAPGGKKEIKQAPIRAAISHLYFESIHPFEDGNGRVGRAISEKIFLQSIGHPLTISLSQSIESDRKAYYNALKTGQASNEITHWISFFINVIIDALDKSINRIDFTLKKTNLFDTFNSHLNERQIKVINKMLSFGKIGFEGGMTAKKYMSITKVSKATATRDLQKLQELGVFKEIGKGRNTAYEIIFDY